MLEAVPVLGAVAHLGAPRAMASPGHTAPCLSWRPQMPSSSFCRPASRQCLPWAEPNGKPVGKGTWEV